MSIIVIELTAAIDAAGTLQTFYVSTDAFVTSPTDNPANIDFDPCVIDPGNIGVHTYSDGITGGITKLETGDIILANSDGRLDDWLQYSFDGRPVTIRSTNDINASYPTNFNTVFTGTVESLDADWERVILRLKDKQFRFQLPALSNRYSGNNSLPSGLEGTANDLKGKFKPRVYGTVFHISPYLVNTSHLTYQVSDGNISDIVAVYDKGASITKGVDYSTSALMEAATPGPGTYITCFAEGYFRLGSNPTGQITADVIQGALATNRTVAQILKSLGTAAGLSAGEISSADVIALDSANSNVVGIYITDETTFQSAMDEVANSIGAFYGFDGSGVLRMGRLLAPTGTPDASIQEFEVYTNIERRVPKDTGIPIWRYTLGHTKVYTTQTSDIAGIATTQRAYLAETYRRTVAEDASIKTQWQLSPQESRDSLLTLASDADTEAARLLALYKVKRTIYDVPVDLSVFVDNSLMLLDIVELVIPRFGMDSGQKFRLIGYRIELQSNLVILQLWG